MTSIFLVWLVAGAALIAGELMTGSFYMLIFGIAAWAGATLAFFGYGIDLQLVASGAVALIGLIVVVRYGKRWREGSSIREADLDIGNEVRVEEAAGSRLKVLYRGATWDAVLDAPGTSAPKTGDYCIIRSVRGNTLVVAVSTTHKAVT